MFDMASRELYAGCKELLSMLHLVEQQQIREVMDKLPAKYYSVVNCMVVKELSVKETARELLISEDNVRKRFERAKLLLKTIMKG